MGDTTPYPMVVYPGDYGEAAGHGSEKFQLLQSAISNCAVPLVHQLIQQTPSLIRERGWHGQTSLHKACLIGDWTISYLLVEAGADPNAKNDNEETPVHYACKRGVASIVHLLIQRGGNIEAVDKNGKNVAHHAAQTGSVYVFKYLEINGVDFNAVDNKRQTPLHIACLHGHVDAFKFLIKAERSDLMQQDSEGNTTFHIAAREGHSYLCWQLLLVKGCSVLHQVNNEGFTPVHLATQRNKIGHKEINPILMWLSKSKPKNYIPTGPRWAWWWLLCMPTVAYSAIAMTAMFVFPTHQGPVFIAGLVAIILLLLRHSHRLYHVSRWPNPVFAGTFAAGLFHTGFIYFSAMFPFTMKYQMYTILCLLMACLTLYMYWKILSGDPGLAKDSVRDTETGRPMTLIDLCVPQRKIDQFCPTCEIVRSPRTKHCRLCEKCFDEMDHHCLFLLTCIAKNNHSFFCWFLFAVLIAMVMFLGNAGLYLSERYEGSSFSSAFHDLFWAQCWILSMVCANAVSIFWGVNLLRFQLNLVSKGQTTVFPSKSQSALTKYERLLNIFYFMTGKKPFARDPLICSQTV